MTVAQAIAPTITTTIKPMAVKIIVKQQQ